MSDWELLHFLHFLRPLWLLAIPALVAVWVLVRRWEGRTRSNPAGFAPHLREALTINRLQQRHLRPFDTVILAFLTTALAAAGPTWSKQPSPWFAETAPLIIALQVSDSMRANDVPPTRLDRARFKLLDLISARTGARTALIAYAGSAHVVMPPTVDAAVIKPFLESLDPAIMPSGGASAATVLPLARRLLGDQAAISTVLFVADGFQPGDAEALETFASQPQAPALAALIMATPTGGLALMPDGTPVLDSRGARLDTRLNESLLSRVAAAANMSIVHADPADRDVQRLLRMIQSNLHRADDPDARWRDQAWWFLWPAAFVVLLWFRRGWTMQW